MKKYTKIQILNIIAFLIVPIISSFISTYHIVNFFQIGNSFLLSMFLSISFELGALASAISITILDKISKLVTWAIFLILIVFQIIGNVYYTFDYIVKQEMLNPKYLDVPQRFITYFWEFETTDEVRMFLSILIGIPIPLISLAFLKTLVDYISNPDEEKVSKEVEIVPTTETELSVVEEVEPILAPTTEEPENVILEEEVSEQPIETQEPIQEVVSEEEPTQQQEQPIEEVEKLKEMLEHKDKVINKLTKEMIQTYPQVYGEEYKSEKI
jgi:hypothetical protein